MAPVRGLLHRKELVGVSRVKSVSSPSCPPVRWLTRLTNFDDDDQVGIRSNRRRGLMKLHIEKTWDGEPLEESDKVLVEISTDETSFSISAKTAYGGQPAPPCPPGSCPGLWDYEVVEVFILGHDERYLEVELGPHQHYLVLQFSGVHACTAEGLPVEYTASIDREGRTWQGQARLPKSYLPPRREGEVFRINAYAIRGEGAERRYLAMYPSTGGEPTPNFHRLQYFQPIDTTLAQRLDVKRDAGTSS